MSGTDNLKPFKKGESGNPNGRPKGSLNRSTIVKKWLSVQGQADNPISGESETMSQEDMITLALIKKAREGDTQAYKALMDSGYGAPKQEVENTNINTDIPISKWVDGTTKGSKSMENFDPNEKD
jgi:hypothetical protein